MKRILRSVFYTILIITALPARVLAAELIPVGQLIGLQLRSDSLTVAAYDDSLGSASRDTGLKIGDELLSIDGEAVSSPEDVRSAISDSETVSLKVRRSGKVTTLRLTPCPTEDGPRLGVYLRQGISGIGTVTYYDPQTGNFGALGHGVCSHGKELSVVRSGDVLDAAIISVKKGNSGTPGQLVGALREQQILGTIVKNTPQGVFGQLTTPIAGSALPVGAAAEVRVGKAVIRSTVNGDIPQEYSVEILKIYAASRDGGRNMLLKITDPALLEATGGIVQGMSGSPIIQDGKLIGAVTHVLVNDPTQGSGIFIENMLNAAA